MTARTLILKHSERFIRRAAMPDGACVEVFYYPTGTPALRHTGHFPGEPDCDVMLHHLTGDTHEDWEVATTPNKGPLRTDGSADVELKEEGENNG